MLLSNIYIYMKQNTDNKWQIGRATISKQKLVTAQPL